MQVDVREGKGALEPLDVEATHPPADAVDRGGVVARASLARGRSLAPGVQKSPFYWRDVVHGPPPRRREKGDCIHVTFHGTDDSGDARIAFTTVVRVDPGLDKESTHDDIVHVEERMYVQRRLLQEFIDRERAFSDRVALRMRSRLAHSMAKQRRRVNVMQSLWLAALTLKLIRLEARAGNACIRGFRSLMRALVAIPDMVLTQTERASIHLASRTGRRWLRRAIHDPGAATPQEKAGVLVWLAVTTTITLLLLSLLFATVLIRWDHVFAPLFGDFLTGVGGTVALPIPSEPIYVARALDLGLFLGGVGLLAGKFLGSWVLYLLGDSLFDTMQKKSGPRMRRTIGWLQRNANRWGFVFLLLLNAIPLAPDALILVFAVSGMRFRSFMLGIAVGSILKFVLLGAMLMLIGPDAVNAFMEHPIQTIRGA